MHYQKAAFAKETSVPLKSIDSETRAGKTQDGSEKCCVQKEVQRMTEFGHKDPAASFKWLPLSNL